MFQRNLIFALFIAATLLACGDVEEPLDESSSPDGGTVVEPPPNDAGMTTTPDTGRDAGETTPPDMTATDGGIETDTGPTEINPYLLCSADCDDQNPAYADRIDCDYDGLSNAEEAALGTDSCENDTDGDGVPDLGELQIGSNPLDTDTDNDGVDDGEEVELGLNPTDPSDGRRWIATACDRPVETESVDYFENSRGDWRIGLPPAFAYSDLTIAGVVPGSKTAAAVFGDPANEVAAFLLSESPSPSQPDSVEALVDLSNEILSVGSIQQTSTGGEFDTHDRNRAAIGRYLVRTNSARTARAVRDSLLTAFGSFAASDIQAGLPVASGSSYNLFRVFVSVTYREDAVAGDRIVVSVAVAPSDKFDTRDKVKFRMDDVTNTTNVARAADTESVWCKPFPASEDQPEADFYWVLDQSGSMSDDYDKVREVANDFYANLNNTTLDFRLAVSPMDPVAQGRPRANVGWHTDLATFLNEITYIESGVYDCCDEFGLAVGEEGISWMRSSSAPQTLQIRPNAELITIWMANEEANTFQARDLSDPAVASELDAYKQFYAANTIAFSITAIEPDDRYADGEAYREVALATGGSFADLDSPDISETIDDIIYAATGAASTYRLTKTPISSTLRVFRNGDYVPRSRENGFDYFAQTNTIAFFGSYRPRIANPAAGELGDDVAVSFQAFDESPKPEE